MKLLSRFGTSRSWEHASIERNPITGKFYTCATIYNPEMFGKSRRNVAFFIASKKNLWELENLMFPLLHLPNLTSLLRENIQYHIYELSDSPVTAYQIIEDVLRHHYEYDYPEASFSSRENFYKTLVKSNCKVECQTLLKNPKSWQKIVESVWNFDGVIVDSAFSRIRENIYPLLEKCNTTKVTLFSSNATTVREGPATGFGNSGLEYRNVSNEQLTMLLTGNYFIKDIMLRKVQESSDILLNVQTAFCQGLEPDKKIITEKILKAPL